MTRYDTEKYLASLAAMTHRALKGNKLVMLITVDEEGYVAVSHAPTCGPECQQKNVCVAELYADMAELLTDESERCLESDKRPVEGLPS